MTPENRLYWAKLFMTQYRPNKPGAVTIIRFLEYMETKYHMELRREPRPDLPYGVDE